MNGLLNRLVVDERLFLVQNERIRAVAVEPTQIATRQEGDDFRLRLRIELVWRVDAGETEIEFVDVEAFGDGKTSTHHERLHRGVATTLWLAAGDFAEEDAQLRVQKRHVAAAEDFGDEGSAICQDMGRDTERREEQLALHVDVHVVETRDVGSAVANDELCLLSFEVIDNFVCCRFRRDVALNLNHSFDGSHLLQIDSYNLYVVLVAVCSTI